MSPRSSAPALAPLRSEPAHSLATAVQSPCLAHSPQLICTSSQLHHSQPASPAPASDAACRPRSLAPALPAHTATPLSAMSSSAAGGTTRGEGEPRIPEATPGEAPSADAKAAMADVHECSDLPRGASVAWACCERGGPAAGTGTAPLQPPPLLQPPLLDGARGALVDGPQRGPCGHQPHVCRIRRHHQGHDCR